jgi:hypothetical protein
MADGVVNPMRVDTSLLHGIAAANTAAAQAKPSTLKSTGTTASFSSALKSASEKETTKPVEGQNYAEILTGPRAGMYLNKSGGPRDGQAFILVKHDGREDHIYGTGKDRVVISSSKDGKDSSAPTDKTSSSAEDTAASGARKGERTKQVDGHAYADILNGSRSGMYLNTSGNTRDGQAFVLVKRHGREFHIYGTGKDRVIVGLKPKADKTDDTSPKTTDTSATDTSSTDTSTSTDTGTDTTTKPGNSVVDSTNG